MAKVTLKLFALLGRFLPPGSKANSAAMDIAEGASISDLIAQSGLDQKDCHLVLLNGNFVAADSRAATPLAEGDVVSIWPPIGGG